LSALWWHKEKKDKFVIVDKSFPSEDVQQEANWESAEKADESDSFSERQYRQEALNAYQFQHLLLHVR
jgi:hypothetical protein